MMIQKLEEMEKQSLRKRRLKMSRRRLSFTKLPCQCSKCYSHLALSLIAICTLALLPVGMQAQGLKEAAVGAPLQSASNIITPDSALTLWYNQPASKWTDALPIGNGHIGAMIYGGIDTAHIQFNEATLWSGRPRNYAHKGAAAYLPKIRQLIFSGKQKAAEDLAEAHFMGIKDHDPEAYNGLRQRWLEKVRRDTAAAGWDYNDRDWKTMDIPLLNGWETAGHQGLDGAVWFRVSFNLPGKWTGKDLYIDLGRIRDQDYCYLNGHYVGSDAGISNKRHYLLKASQLRPGKNVIAIQVINFFDKGGFTGVKNDRPIFVVYPADGSPQKGMAISRTWKYMVQDQAPPAYPQYEASYQPFGDIYITDLSTGNNSNKEAEKITNYRRELNLHTATARVTYQRNKVRIQREYWASAADPFMAIRWHADKSGALNLKVVFGSVHSQHEVYRVDDHTLGLKVQVKGGALYGVSELRLTAKGKQARIRINAGAAVITGGDAVELYLVAATNFKNYKDVSADPALRCDSFLDGLKNRDYTELYKRHIKRYQQLFNRFDIRLGQSSPADVLKQSVLSVPTDERIRRFSPKTDPGLIALYTQYGRYLMISSTPPDGRTANLQGIWNELLTPPWGSKYTTNINLEMNYWPAEPLNLSECTEPLFRFMKELKQAGHLTADLQYGAPGWVEHHNTDIWAATAPIDASKHGIWVGGAAWLSHHLWDHYLYTKDTTFLRKQGYPIMKSAAEFYAHFLVKDPKTGYLVSCPSNSPEHGGLVAGPTMDHQLIRDLFEHCMAAARVLHTDAAFIQLIRQKYKQIAPNRIGHMGQLQEWMEDIDDSTDTHRHVSHLWGVYPGNDISWDKDSAMMRAARQSVLFRGDDGTGWSLAWKVNLWARFKDGNHALRLLGELLRPAEGASGQERGGVYHNMMDAHPPFQIDGNFGGAAGVAEMLLQSQNGYIELLPALPDDLSSGAVRGLRARGDLQLDFSWAKRKLNGVNIHAGKDGLCSLRYQGHEIQFETRAGASYYFNGALEKQNSPVDIK